MCKAFSECFQRVRRLRTVKRPQCLRQTFKVKDKTNTEWFSIYLDPRLQGLSVLGLESLLDVSQVDLRSRDDDADEGLVVGS